jgi:hypothetical protein
MRGFMERGENGGGGEPPPMVSRSILPDEMDAVFAGPANLANKFYVVPTPHGFRISFCEVFGDPPRPAFRCAVVLGVEDAIALQAVLTDQLNLAFQQSQSGTNISERQLKQSEDGK